MVLLFAGVFVLMSVMGNVSLVDAFFEVCSAQGTVGKSVGLTGAQMPALAKLMLIVNIWSGRLEVFPVLMLIQAMLGALPRRKRKPVTPYDEII